MTVYEGITIIISGSAFITSIIAIIVSIRSSQKSNRTSIEIARRDKIIELHNSWRDVKDINPTAPIGPDVLAALNALDLTASMWNHDGIDKEIIMQSYWDPFRDLYDKLINMTNLIPGKNQTPKDSVKPSIKKAYKEMESRELNNIKQTGYGKSI